MKKNKDVYKLGNCSNCNAFKALKNGYCLNCNQRRPKNTSSPFDGMNSADFPEMFKDIFGSKGFGGTE